MVVTYIIPTAYNSLPSNIKLELLLEKIHRRGEGAMYSRRPVAFCVSVRRRESSRVGTDKNALPAETAYEEYTAGCTAPDKSPPRSYK